MRQAPLALLVAALAGCGGDGRSPEEVAREYLTSDDPAKCDDAALPFLERRTRRRGDAARATCRRNVERTKPPRDVEYRDVSVRDGRARVRFAVGSQPVLVELTEEDGRWKVTGLR